ncbi:MAG: DMT family transporter, partial [Patescibacteria group bacterium]
LVLTTGAKAGFIHKTLFIYVAFLAFFFLKERLTKAVVLGFLALTASQILFLQIQPAALTRGDAFILVATLLWAIELVIAKRLMNHILPNIIAASRMLFGGIFIGIYVVATAQWQGILTLSQPQVGWIAVTTLLLVGYVMTFYNGLRYVPAHVASSVLALGAPITLLLQAVFQDKTVSAQQIVGMCLMTVSVLVIIRILVTIWNKPSYVLARDH